ncbi:MAG: ASKHA domain-containing protein [Bacillota bacterium]
MRTEHTLSLQTGKRTIEILFAGTPLLRDVLQERGVAFAHPCGGRGVCLKCAVEARGNVSPPDAIEQAKGARLSCRLRLLGDCEVTLPEQPELAKQTIMSDTRASALLMAADVGTTTLEIRLFDAQTGAPVAGALSLNPQVSFSADVIGRITAALEGKGEAMRAQLLDALREMIRPYPPVERAVITGNTVMLYLLTGRSPKALAAAPFAADCLFGHTETVLGFPAYLPRCTGAFTGADLTCALLFSGMTERAETSLLCDIGTNGEIALWHQGKLSVTSTAVGPAFEGAGISCGMGGVPGAIDKVWAAQNALDFHVIGGGKPLGVCGSGLIDAVAAMLRLRIIDEYGTMDGQAARIAGDIVLTQRDIRQVQLAKAAVAAGIETLMDAAGVSQMDVQTLFIAGRFGSHLDARSAAAIGLFPRSLAQKAQVLGNAALEGACQLLLYDALRDKADGIARAAEAVQLSGNSLFAEKFVWHMDFQQ